VLIGEGWLEAGGEDTLVIGSTLAAKRVKACEGLCTKGITCKSKRGTKSEDGSVK
jgi:putative component of membrane protein insertase Oxa1/YidC/SpoIIIJ protein YidD